MCGRYATTRSAADLSALFEAFDETGGRLAADYNVAPTDPVPVVRRDVDSDPPVLSVARWGLLPHWAKDTRGAARMINARAETVATTRAYAQSFARRRCLVPADGWYEWVRRDGGKQAYFMTPRDGGVLAFAGLWSRWHGAGEPLLTTSVVTTAALGELALVHDRMPLLLPRDRWADWLDGDDDPAVLLAPPDGKSLAEIEIRPVGKAVGDVRNDGPELVARVPAAPLRALPEGPMATTLF
ncbi:SOS response-associated peptidase [Micromonospora sp. WMMD1102]|uniref:SOS response-associated peptidase n=1 Tax=Micromonospora sp. WMMD1102 TaxID=3016105 RepID=UPI0024151CFE|nr:SOS response-associated peptidase [Micromonospora sp. WMMD1102]MDG4784682.1 SOS response-associated peptidase [Micromonospora sp. WMMD1102]